MFAKVIAALRGKLMGKAGLFFLAKIVERAIPFLMLPILTRYLTRADYGIVTMLTVVFGILQPFVHLNITGAVVRRFYDTEEQDFEGYISTGFSLIMMATVATSLVLIPTSIWLEGWLQIPRTYLMILPPVIMCYAIYSLKLSIWQVQGKAIKYGVLSVAKTFIEGALSIGLVVGLSWGWEGRAIGFLVANALVGVVGFLLLNHAQKLKPFYLNRVQAKHALLFGLPLVPHALGSWGLSALDRVFLTNMTSVDITGLFAVGASIASILGMLTTSFHTAWTPWCFEQLKTHGELAHAKLVKITYIYALIIFAGALALGWLAPFFLTVFVGEQFQRSSEFVLWLCLGQAFHGMYLMMTNYIFYVQRTKFVAYSTVLAVVINAVANYALISTQGGVGAAQATTLAHAVHFLACFVAVQYLHPLPWLRKAT